MTSRTTAQNERYHLIVTLWASPEHRRLGGASWRGATGVLTATGDVLTITDEGGRVWEYPPVLDPSLEGARAWSTAAQSLTITLPWTSTSVYPSDLDLRHAVAELAMIDEANGGTSVAAWRSRQMIISGRCRPISTAAQWQGLTFSFADPELEDDGDIFEPGEEFTSDMFPDMASTDDRAVAPQALGRLPVRVYAPSGSTLWVPCPVVVDEVVGTYQARRYMIGRNQPANTGSTQFRLVDDGNDSSFCAGPTSTYYQASLTSYTDGLGNPWWGVSGQFEEVTGSAVTFTLSSATATVPGISDKISAGDVVRGSSSGSVNDYELVTNVSGDTITLNAVYTGTTQTTSGTAKVIRQPVHRLDCLYRLVSSGGDADAYGNPISNVIDVMIDLFKDSVIPFPIVTYDLKGMASKFSGQNVTWFGRDRMTPLSKIMSIQSYLPIRRYRDNGALRFQYVGYPTPQEIRTTINLDTLGQAYRLEPVDWDDEPAYPIVEVAYNWDSFKSAYQGRLVLDGTAIFGVNSTRIPTGRAKSAYNDWVHSATDTQKRRQQCPRLSMELDTVETFDGAFLAASWLLYQYGIKRQTVTLDVDGSYRWLDPGDLVYLIETGVVNRYATWRVERLAFNGMGQGRLMLRREPMTPGEYWREPLWGERDGDLWGSPGGAV